MTLQQVQKEIIKEFRIQYKKAYKDILSDEILAQENDWFENFIKQATRRTAKEMSEICDIELKNVQIDCNGSYILNKAKEEYRQKRDIFMK